MKCSHLPARPGAVLSRALPDPVGGAEFGELVTVSGLDPDVLYEARTFGACSVGSTRAPEFGTPVTREQPLRLRGGEIFVAAREPGSRVVFTRVDDFGFAGFE